MLSGAAVAIDNAITAAGIDTAMPARAGTKSGDVDVQKQ